MLKPEDAARRGRFASRRFGWVQEGQCIGPEPVVDVDLRPNAPAAVVPTLGSIVPGWVLLIPRRTALSVARLRDVERRELVNLAKCVSRTQRVFASRSFLLEHGSSTVGTVVGCGVDQAHLHLVPLQVDFMAHVLETEASRAWFEVDPLDPWKSLDAKRDYYLFSDLQSAYAAYPEVKQSQFFRRIIARALARPEEWDYRTWSSDENARKTIAHLG